eukprot:361276-Chlamydomonas_euryale.AAC.4
MILRAHTELTLTPNHLICGHSCRHALPRPMCHEAGTLVAQLAARPASLGQRKGCEQHAVEAAGVSCPPSARRAVAAAGTRTHLAQL